MPVNTAGHISGDTSVPMVHKPKSKQAIEPAPLEWDWDIEHEDRKKEAQADASMHHAQPFQVDRRVLKDVVWEKMGAQVGRIRFLSSGEPIAQRQQALSCSINIDVLRTN